MRCLFASKRVILLSLPWIVNDNILYKVAVLVERVKGFLLGGMSLDSRRSLPRALTRGGNDGISRRSLRRA
jgi:hypothetical protein